jgi:hypothetical protein
MRMRRAADIRADTVVAARADRWERALAELRRIDSRAVAGNGKSDLVSNATHHADLAGANRRAAPAEREAALWRATAEVLRLHRDIRREQAQRTVTRDHYGALRLLNSSQNGCSEDLMVRHGFSIDTWRT